MIQPVLIQITPSFLWVVFTLLVLIAGIMCAVLFFHWRRYGFRSIYTVIAESVFVGVSAVLLLFALLSAVSFSAF